MIYDMQFASREENLPEVLARSEGDPPLNIQGDPNVNLCYDNLGITFDFLHKVFGRNSIDGKGGPGADCTAPIPIPISTPLARVRKDMRLI